MEDIISGRNPVRELLKAGNKTVNKVLISEKARGDVIGEIDRLARERNIPVHHVPAERLDRLSIENNQGVVAEIAPVTYLDLDELWNSVKEKKNPLLVVLDGIEDPHNLGAIIRNAVTLGADGVIIGKWRSVGLTESVAKASAGASEYMPIARVTNIAETVTRLKEKQIWVVGADAAGKSVREEKFAFPMALVIGSEGEGLHRLVKDRCDYLISIPQTSPVSSLNASCASAVLLYEIYLQKSR